MENQAKVAHLGEEITLTTTDRTIVNYVQRFKPHERQEKILEALRVGIVALETAVPHLDTGMVERRFADFANDVQETIRSLRKKMDNQMRELFHGDNAALPALLNQFAGPGNSAIRALMEKQLGPGSEFYKKLDPANREGVIMQTHAIVEAVLQKSTSEILRQFSLDQEDSSISRLQSVLAKRIDEFDAKSSGVLMEIKKAIGVKEEAGRGTAQGADFESKVGEFLQTLAGSMGATAEDVGNTTGSIAKCKKGDHVLTLGESSGAPEYRIVLESKNAENVSIPKAVAELQEAKKNRESEAGIFIYKKGKEPAGFIDFQRQGGDFLVTVDEADLDSGRRPIYLDAAVRIAATMASISARAKAEAHFDKSKATVLIQDIEGAISKAGQIRTKAATVESHGRIIQELAQDLENTVRTKVGALGELW